MKQAGNEAVKLPCEQWDLMLSYRWAKYKPLVTTLARFLSEAGVSYWLDTDVIDQTVRHPSNKLRDILRGAAEASRIVVGYPSEDMLEMDPLSHESNVKFSWLFWERQFAHEILWIEGNNLCSFPNERIPFYNYPHLAYYLGIVAGKGNTLNAYWHKYFGAMLPTSRLAYRTEDLHSLKVALLPCIIDPKSPEVRRNAILRSSIEGRNDIANDHRMQLL